MGSSAMVSGPPWRATASIVTMTGTIIVGGTVMRMSIPMTTLGTITITAMVTIEPPL